MPNDPVQVAELDRIIHKELILDKVTREAERTLKTYITMADQDGIEAIVLGAAELSRIVDTKANVLPIYDSTVIHADAAVDWILSDAP
jgi:aspartate racemase